MLALPRWKRTLKVVVRHLLKGILVSKVLARLSTVLPVTTMISTDSTRLDRSCMYMHKCVFFVASGLLAIFTHAHHQSLGSSDPGKSIRRQNVYDPIGAQFSE